MDVALIASKALVCIILVFHLGACQNDNDNVKPEPPALPSQQELESRFSRYAAGKWEFFSEVQFVYAIQKYCVYTDECQTEHVWLGRGWGYAFPSYRTVMRSQSITIDRIYLIHASNQEMCPSGQRGIPTYHYITGQGVWDQNGKMVHYFCVEKIVG